MKIGDLVVMRSKDSWVDGMCGLIEELHTRSSDGIYGVQITVPGHGYTIVHPSSVTVIRNADAVKTYLTGSTNDLHRGETQPAKLLPHEFDSSMKCKYCGAADKELPNSRPPCPARK